LRAEVTNCRLALRNPALGDSCTVTGTPTFPTLRLSHASRIRPTCTASCHLRFEMSDRPAKRVRLSSNAEFIESLQCQVCHLSYERADHLSRHLDSRKRSTSLSTKEIDSSTDRNERSFRCEQCPASFNRRSVMTRDGTKNVSATRRDCSELTGLIEIYFYDIKQHMQRTLQMGRLALIVLLRGQPRHATPVLCPR
jgi:hypothetical protein